MKNEVESLTSLMTDTDVITSALHTSVAKSRHSRYQPSPLQLRLSFMVIAATFLIVIISGFVFISQSQPPDLAPVATTRDLVQETIAAAFDADLGQKQYNYLVVADLNDELRAGMRVRLATASFDHGEWHYAVVAEDERCLGVALETQLVYVEPSAPPRS
ncbi:MAG TPA: hypothetical protein VHO69_15690 [Phototrophicaceae bacterium]|nr:hypothetical protein [Phototrophicaceae bacterium]